MSDKELKALVSRGVDVDGLTDYSKKHPKMLIVSNYGLDMNVTMDHYATIVNKHGFAKIGNDLYQFKRDAIFKVDTRNIAQVVSNVDKQVKLINLSEPGKTTAPGDLKTEGAAAVQGSFSNKCENTKDVYRLIAYEEFTQIKDVNNPAFSKSAYLIKLRGLRKRLGFWGNRDNSYYKAHGYYYGRHVIEGNPSYSTQSYSKEYTGSGTDTWGYIFFENIVTYSYDHPEIFSSEHHAYSSKDLYCVINNQ